MYLGSSEQSALAGAFCGSSIPDPITSKTGFYLVFKADDLANGNGFIISYAKETLIGLYKLMHEGLVVIVQHHFFKRSLRYLFKSEITYFG